MLIEEPTGVRARTRVGRIEAVGGLSATTWIVIAITAVGTALRFATLTSQSYWLDESQAAHELSLSFGHMLSAWNAAEWNPPLYLIVAWPWARVFGTGEAGLRSLSAVFGTALIPVLYLCGRELVSRRAGVLAAAFAALNPFMIWYSQEAREYMLLTLLSAASLLFFARTLTRPAHPRRELAWWAVLSALAVLTQYFAGFLVLAEGLWLIWRLRSRIAVGALAVQGVVLGPFVPHVLPQLRKPAEFIVGQPLQLRIKQVPITFAFNTLYKSTLVTWGLVGGAIAVAIVIALLLAGATDRQLKGAGLAAALATFAIVVPLLLALVGHDDFLARGLMPAWPALAIVFAAACAAPRARVPGAAVAVVLLAAFVWAGVRIDSHAAFQRPDWRGVAAALGPMPAGSPGRAIVADPGQFGAGPLSVYLPGVAWAGPGEAPGTGLGPATVSELDVVANVGQTLSRGSGGARLIGSRAVDGYLIGRYALTAPVAITGAQAITDADGLVPGSPSGAEVLFQAPTV
jgi:hypothetical protein